MSKKRTIADWLIIAVVAATLLLLAAPAAYVGGYFALAHQGPGLFKSGYVTWAPAYHGDGQFLELRFSALFSLIHQADREWIRPGYWHQPDPDEIWEEGPPLTNHDQTTR